MDRSTDIDNLLIELNRCLPFEQQIRKNDPMYAAIKLNQVVLDYYVHIAHKNLNEALHQLVISSKQQVERAADIADRLISKSGNNIEEQLDKAAQRWEERLGIASAETQANIQHAYWLAWAGAISISITACIIIGSWLGNLVFDVLFHHAASSAHHLVKKAGH